MICDARIRPLPNDTEIVCEKDGEHTRHRGTLRNYAYPGSETTVDWLENDRRNFHGEWPGDCPDCILPLGHDGKHSEFRP